MTPLSFHDAVHQAMAKDPRYTAQAYEFVQEALHLAVKVFRGGEGNSHVSGQEVLEGVRRLALEEYGPMALLLLNEWGLYRGEDVGNIVYGLIETGYFGKNDGDSLDDFRGGYDFETAFNDPFRPTSQRQKQIS
jgi:uncharacterized repeat protein (TIGR04138 family)